MTTLAAGSRLGQYEIRAPIGAGGMGEVYRAHDARLEREVAIKILPPALAGDPSALARFEREAKAVAALSHPHILAIHDFGREGTTVYAVMELLEGQTLRQRLADGALPLRKTLDFALQIAQALAAAHEKGIVHRDLKPDNVIVTTAGRVKILDFGLAKAIEVHPNAGETVAASREASTPGLVVGTIGYMSPEQVTGAPVDHRTDIFAFGAVVYEMLTGRAAFGRASNAETIAAVLREDVPEVPAAAGVPPPLERILRRCLEKNPAERFHSAHDVGIALEALLDRSATSSAGPARAPVATRRSLRAVVAASTLAVLAIAALAGVVWSTRGPRAAAGDGRVRKFHVSAPRLVVSRDARPVISPDGQKLAFVSGDSLWIQELDQLDPRQLALSWRPQHLFWSPDSAFVGFLSEEKLWKVSVAGGQPIALGDVPTAGGGASGAWRADGRIVFSRSVSSSGLLELSQDGGEARSIAALQTGDGDFHEPSLLPNDDGQLIVVHRTEGPDTIAAIRGESRTEVLRLPGEYLSFPQYSSTGHIVFGRTGKSNGIWAVPFHPTRLERTGEPFLVAAGAFSPSLSREGTLTFIRRVWSEPRQLVFISRAGVVESAIGEPQPGLRQPVLAPDQNRVAVAVGAVRGDIWIYELQRVARRRLTFLETEVIPSGWTANKGVVFTHVDGARLRPLISAQAADGTGTPAKLADGCCGILSASGTLIFAKENDARDSDSDLYYRGPGDTAPKVLLDRKGSQEVPALSPDGRYVAYQSNESGRYEIYVRPFPSGAGQWQISLAGGGEARWSAHGDKLWFRAYGNILMEVDVKSSGETFAFGEPREVFKGDPIAVDLTLGYVVLGNGERFIAARRTADPDGSVPSVTVVQNWFAEVGTKR